MKKTRKRKPVIALALAEALLPILAVVAFVPIASVSAGTHATGGCGGVVLDTRCGGWVAATAVLETRFGDFASVTPVSLRTLPHPSFVITIK